MSGNKKKISRYAEAGVDIEAGNRFIDVIKPIVSQTFRSGVITEIGGFAGLFSLNTENMKKPVLISSTDGVGTKLKIAFMMDKHDTIGIDLVAMSVNDIIVQGAVPLFFLDYLSMGKLDVEIGKEVVKGIAQGCLQAECSLIGGETAEMAGFYDEGEYDLAGFVVGIANNDDLLDGSEIAVGNTLIGIRSSGLHSNSYSLVRKVFFEDLKMSVHDHVDDFGRTLGEELLEPTRIYARTIKNLRRDFRILGVCHITGGGLVDNIPRILPKGCRAIIDRSTWTPHSIFPFLQKAADIPEHEMMQTFNNGLGLVLVASEKDTSDILQRLEAMGESAYSIGSIEARKVDEPAVRFVS